MNNDVVHFFNKIHVPDDLNRPFSWAGLCKMFVATTTRVGV
jgi:hypothetical protein